MEGSVKILETYPNSEEITSFYPIFWGILQTLYTSEYVEQNGHVFG